MAVGTLTLRRSAIPYPRNYDGGCTSGSGCGRAATHWLHLERFGDKRYVSWPYCEPCLQRWLNDSAAGATSSRIKRDG